MAQRQLLVVHTDLTACKKVASPLARSGAFSVEVTNSPFDAAVELFTREYDGLILHVDTPGFDVINVIARIRSSERTAQLPIVVLLNNHNPLLLRTLKAVGVNEFMIEPVNTTELINSLYILTNIVRPETQLFPSGVARMAEEPEATQTTQTTPAAPGTPTASTTPTKSPYSDDRPQIRVTPDSAASAAADPGRVAARGKIDLPPAIDFENVGGTETELVDRIWACIKRADTIPGIPTEITRMNVIIGDLSGDKISKEIVGLDLNLAIGILRQVNSIDFRGLETISGLTRAMHRIGIREINQRFNDSYQSRRKLPVHTRDFILGGFARHSLMVACLAEEIASSHRGWDADTAFSAGLLHDVGKLFLVHNFPESYQLVQDADKGLWDKNGQFCDIAAIERELLQLDHGIAGYELCRAWLLPPAVQAGALHHETNSSLRYKIKDTRITTIVAVADLVDQIMENETISEAIEDLDQFFLYPDREVPIWLGNFVKGMPIPLRTIYERANKRVRQALSQVHLVSAK